jgi:cysteinyl-tRNA synthetase
MSLQLYNTLTRQLESFEPLSPGRVSLYTCGPTVWNYAHIGNFRTFLFEDLLRRWLEVSGYAVYHIMNLTDVDDRIIKEAGAKGQSIRDFVAPYIEAFQKDREYLRIMPAHDYPRATHYIPAMVRLVEGLLERGIAYRSDDGSVYFSIDRFPAYGALSQLDRRELRAGASARVSTDEYAKEDARDFALWKAARPEDEAVGAAWDAPFGRGRPGWHLECSAMALDLLKRRFKADVLDIHAGGVDLIFPHHEDEIAQSCAYTGETHFARYWMHGEFLNVRGAKMSKRFGNITTPRDLREDGIDAGAIRLLVFQTHYRQKLDLTDHGLRGAQEASRRLGEFGRRLLDRVSDADTRAFVLAGARLRDEVREAFDADLNAPRAIAAMFDFMNEANRLLDGGERPGPSAVAEWQTADAVLDIATVPRVTEVRPIIRPPIEGDPPLHLPEDPPEEPEALETWALAWATMRANAKAQRDFAAADRIRKMLRSSGFEVRDRRDGVIELVRL